LRDFHKFRLIASSGNRAGSADRQTNRQMDRQKDRRTEMTKVIGIFFLRLSKRAEKWKKQLRN